MCMQPFYNGLNSIYIGLLIVPLCSLNPFAFMNSYPVCYSLFRTASVPLKSSSHDQILALEAKIFIFSIYTHLLIETLKFKHIHSLKS